MPSFPFASTPIKRAAIRGALIGGLPSSALETFALVGVTVHSEVDFRSPHPGCQGRNAATCEAPIFRTGIMGESLLAVIPTRRPSHGGVCADAAPGRRIGIRLERPPVFIHAYIAPELFRLAEISKTDCNTSALGDVLRGQGQ